MNQSEILWPIAIAQSSGLPVPISASFLMNYEENTFFIFYMIKTFNYINNEMSTIEKYGFLKSHQKWQELFPHELLSFFH